MNPRQRIHIYHSWPYERLAPPGFTENQWETFIEDGVIVMEDALSQDEVDELLAALDRTAHADEKYEPGAYADYVPLHKHKHKTWVEKMSERVLA